MNLELKRPLAFFDLETTGLNIATDRIVEISIVKIMPNGNKEVKTKLINPTIPISKESAAIHGISDEKVRNEPTFKELSVEFDDFIKGCDLAGFNSNRFDVPLLAEEFLRAGIDFNVNDRKLVDVQNIFHKMEQRTLVAAYKFYCDKDLTNAHSAEADTTATYEILEAQIEKYADIKGNTTFLSEFSQVTKNADLLGRFVYDENEEVVFNFGKHKGKPVTEVLTKEPGYYSWMMNGDFPLYTKKVMKDIKEKMPKAKPQPQKAKTNKPAFKKKPSIKKEPTTNSLDMLKNKFNS